MGTAVMMEQIAEVSARLRMKRIIIATFFGLVVGVLCATAGIHGGFLKFTAVDVVWVLWNRAVMGFVIGTSGLKLHWAWNGVVMGLVVGSIFSYSLFMSMGLGTLPLANLLIGNPIFGLMIEFFTTVVFKQPSLAASREKRASPAGGRQLTGN
jgi:hypothetical protein